MNMHRTPGPRLAKLERLARERPCPVCGRAYRPHDPSAPVPDLLRLTADARDELARLLGAAATPRCPQCGRSGHDLARLNDDQKRHALRLLRVPFGGVARSM